MANEWLIGLYSALLLKIPEKYLDGTFIGHRFVNEEFTINDFNPYYYQTIDALNKYIGCQWKETKKSYILSQGELATVEMLNECKFSLYSNANRRDVSKVMVMAYFRDMDSILSRYLPKEIMKKLQRSMKYEEKEWKKYNDPRCYTFWDERGTKFLPLSEDDYQQIDSELKQMSEEELVQMYDSKDYARLVNHILKVMQLAFDTKNFSLEEFSDEACKKAIAMYEDIFKDLLEEEDSHE